VFAGRLADGLFGGRHVLGALVVLAAEAAAEFGEGLAQGAGEGGEAVAEEEQAQQADDGQFHATWQIQQSQQCDGHGLLPRGAVLRPAYAAA
jgi:hypothetical protein